MVSRLTETDFEEQIVEELVRKSNYEQRPASSIDISLGLDTQSAILFVTETQETAWSKLVGLHGGDSAKAETAFIHRLANELTKRGSVDVLRNGITDYGVAIKLAYFAPASGLTPQLAKRYKANRLIVVRQAIYERSSNELDLLLCINGIPVATAELKNRATGQTVEDGKKQYRMSRDSKNLILSRRCFVHFALDTEVVAMTTKLEDTATRFLPFNVGYLNGAGNPPRDTGCRSSYLWQEVWQRDAWLDIVQRFVHVVTTQVDGHRRQSVIFPRFHQWDAVRKIAAAASADGSGNDYLVQHSAGSGKSNTIAWLAHRLSTLHDVHSKLVFDKVVIISDRRILDSQLQDTVYQFDHVHGVVKRIDKNSKQLASALVGDQAKVVITTLQKFPEVVRQGQELPDRTYAIIVDEAHSSQSGEGARKLKELLGTEPATDETGEELVGEILEYGAKTRGPQRNLSFFAFTATPKGRTLELFGTLNTATDRYEPFHLYSMRQAIEEKFIIDVLEHYVTYKTYWSIEKATEDDPVYESKKAKAAIAKYVSLHEHNLSQKAEIIIEHFRRFVMDKIGGRAKAMVVASSRIHAVRYTEALRDYCNKHGYSVGVLVAFSGTVLPGEGDFSEANMNGFPESETSTRFADDGWHVLVVANKYQTGFDQPLLYAMYVDKVLTDLAAVQTLSRLNRIHELKEGTFVLDFRNEADSIREAFAPWYTATIAPPSDPNLLYDTRHALDEFGVLREDELAQVASLIISSANHGRVHSAIAATVDRFFELEAGQREDFRDCLNRFVRVYAFLAQVVTFADEKLERDYLCCRVLLSLLRDPVDAGVDLGSDVELTHIRTERTFEGAIELGQVDGEVSTVFSSTGKSKTVEEERLSRIIDTLNTRFGTDWSVDDRIFYDRVADKLTTNSEIQQSAAVNSSANFKLVLQKAFTAALMEQLGIAEDMVLKLLDDAEMQEEVVDAYLPLIQTRAKVAWQQHCPIGDLLGPDLESPYLEYKASLRTHEDSGEFDRLLETASLKTICAFLNSRDGGTLLLGVSDDGSVRGLVADYESMAKADKDPRDLYQLHLINIVAASMGAAAATNILTSFHSVDEKDVCRVHVLPSATPVVANVRVMKSGQVHKGDRFFVRVGNGSRELTGKDRESYEAGRWK